MARRRVEQHRPQAENVAGRPDVVAESLLRGHEPGRAEFLARRRTRLGGLGGLGDPEVDHPGAVLGQQHVRGLQITVYHACRVDRAQALRQARRQRQHGIDGQRAVVAHRFGQRRPSDITRGQPRYRAVQVRVDHVRGEHAAHHPGRGDFVLEPSSELRIRGQVAPDHLDRNLPPARRKAQEHPPHAAAAQPP